MNVWCITRSLLQQKEPHIQLLGVQWWLAKTLNVTVRYRCTQPSNRRFLQLVSLSSKPTSKSTTPETIKNKPTKSNSLRCSFKDFPLCGLRLRKKNRRTAAMPPVGLSHTVKKSVRTRRIQDIQIDEETPMIN